MGHPKETGKTGVGRRRDPSKPRERIKPESKKQRTRNKKVIHPNFERVLKLQREMYEENFCQAGMGEWRDKCPNFQKGKKYPLVPDHVNTRNGKNPDRCGNLQPLCSWCNYQKGSKRIDFRPVEFWEACEKLDIISEGERGNRDQGGGMDGVGGPDESGVAGVDGASADLESEEKNG